MTELVYNFRAMAQAADDIKHCHNALVREKEGLEAFLRNLKGDWWGGTSDQWQQSQRDWNTSCDDVNGMLMGIFNALEMAIGNAAGVEHALEQLWS